MKKTNLILLFALISLFTKVYAQNFKGLVLDNMTKQAIPFADVYFSDLKTGTITAEDGTFEIPHFKQEKVQIQISYLGYKTIVETINTTTTKQKTFYLEESHYKIDEVVIAAPTGKLQQESVISVTHLKLANLEETAPITLAESISNIPGVAQNTTGAGIGKPVIRGLSGNRIVTYAQGIRIENQQWGDEHGLGVGEVGIESVEVIKGAASLLYGSDALGGVLYFIDERYAKHNTYELTAKTKFLSNTLGSISNVTYKIHKDKLKFNLFASNSTQADYQLPNTKRIFNTRFNEKNIKTSFGFNKTNWISNLRYSFLQNKFGITEDNSQVSVAERNFILPFQVINNYNLSFENTFFIKDSKLQTTLGYTSNYRREFEDDIANPAMGLRLNTTTYNIKWHSPVLQEHYSFIIGTQGMLQTNTNTGSETLIPDATSKDFGLFALGNLEFGKLVIQTGLRLDNRMIDTKSNSNITSFSDSYQGLSFSSGFVYKKEKTKFRFNISSGFRAPNTSELLANGVHEGTNRYEKGSVNLKNENATQVDFSFDYTTEHLRFSINPFYNSMKNYIYLSPTNIVINGDPVFQYLQKNAYLYGGEIGVHYHPHQMHWLHIESNLSAVYAEDSDKNPLPLIPQTHLNTTLRAVFSSSKKLTLKSIYVQDVYKFKQDRIGAFESFSKAYNLLNIGASLALKTKANPIKITTGIKNIFNTEYIDHLSRFKDLGIPNQGRNFYISLKFNLTKKIGSE